MDFADHALNAGVTKKENPLTGLNNKPNNVFPLGNVSAGGWTSATHGNFIPGNGKPKKASVWRPVLTFVFLVISPPVRVVCHALKSCNGGISPCDFETVSSCFKETTEPSRCWKWVKYVPSSRLRRWFRRASGIRVLHHGFWMLQFIEWLPDLPNQGCPKAFWFELPSHFWVSFRNQTDL